MFLISLKIILFIFAAWLFAAQSIAQQAHSNPGTGNMQYIDPQIGNVGALLEPTRPTVQLPHQLIRMYPERDNYLDDQISSFPLTIVSHRMGEVFAIKPTVKELAAAAWEQKLGYDNDLEVTRPWYYSTYLVNDEVTVEFTPEKKSAIFRFSFPAKVDTKTVLFDMYDDDGSYTFEKGWIVRGEETYNGDIKVYLYGEFNIPGKCGTLVNGQVTHNETISGHNAKAWISFPSSTTNVEFRYAISYISAAQAIVNFNEQVKGRSFASIKAKAEEAWYDVINQVKVTGGTTAQKRSFYTALYRCNERMVDITEDHQYYSGFDKKIHTTVAPFYVDDWIWDTYLALHPLRAILNPPMERDMLNSYVRIMNKAAGCRFSRYYLAMPAA